MRLCVCGSVSVLVCLAVSVAGIGFDGIRHTDGTFKFCERRGPTREEQCCTGRRHPLFPTRDDECTMPIEIPVHGPHKCYCDNFCDRTPQGGDKDCCPDWGSWCKGVTPPPVTTPTGDCKDQDGHEWSAGQSRVQMNCWTCDCTARGWSNCEPTNTNLADPDSTCLIQPKIISEISSGRGRYSWTASNYTQFWGKTLKDGVTFRLGTLYPEDQVKQMKDVIADDPTAPAEFDARQKWPNSISGVLDQRNCGASWAFSTVSVMADRNAIMAGKGVSQDLSPQQLLSCNQHKNANCNGGYLDRAWWYARNMGLVNEQCYPYQSGRTNTIGSCQISDRQAAGIESFNCPAGIGGSNKVHKTTPPYKIPADEEQIKHEISENGPVQATFRVYEDFFHYKSGVYRKMPDVRESPDEDRNGYHSVKIIGYGTEGGEKYWLCQNSWGPNWGENGLFKIVRGENHCEVESFVITVVGYRAKKKRKLRKLRRRKLLL